MPGACAIGIEDSLSQAGLAGLLETELAVPVIHCAASFSALMCLLAREPSIDFAIIDEELPGLQSVSGVRDVRLKFPRARVAILGAALERQNLLAFLSVGIHGYVPRVLQAPEMRAAFQLILEGRIYVPSLLAETPIARVHDAPNAGAALDLTSRQREVLALMMAGESNKRIARALGIAEGTVKVHLNAAFRLLGVHNRMSAIEALRSRERRSGADSRATPDLFAANGKFAD